MLVKIRHSVFPMMSGPVLVDSLGLPRYWAAVWASFLPADLAPSTLSQKLGRVEAFYQHVDESQGLGGLDDALGKLDVDAICEHPAHEYRSFERAPAHRETAPTRTNQIPPV